MSLTSVSCPIRYAGDGDQAASGILTSKSFRLLARAPLMTISPWDPCARLRRLDRGLPAEICAGERTMAGADQLRGRALENYLAAQLAGARSEVDDVIRGRIVSSSCSTTMTVLPRSRSRASVVRACDCRADAGRSTARPEHRARRSGSSQSAWRDGCAAFAAGERRRRARA